MNRLLVYTVPVGDLASAVTALATRWNRFLKAGTMNLLIGKGAEKLAELLVGAPANDVKIFLEMLVDLCREQNRRFSVYSGSNLEEYCQELVLTNLFGTKQTWFQRMLRRS